MSFGSEKPLASWLMVFFFHHNVFDIADHDICGDFGVAYVCHSLRNFESSGFILLLDTSMAAVVLLYSVAIMTETTARMIVDGCASRLLLVLSPTHADGIRLVVALVQETPIRRSDSAQHCCFQKPQAPK